MQGKVQVKPDFQGAPLMGAGAGAGTVQGAGQIGPAPSGYESNIQTSPKKFLLSRKK